jgi:hypothetical protein
MLETSNLPPLPRKAACHTVVSQPACTVLLAKASAGSAALRSDLPGKPPAERPIDLTVDVCPGAAPTALSPSSIIAAAHQRLAQSSHGFQAVCCQFDQGVLTLRGRVASYYLKQLAQAVVRQLAGVQQVRNCLEVAAARPR